MPSLASVGARQFRLRYEQRALDENGDRLGDWEVQFTRWTAITWLRGSEAVQAQRLQGLQPALLVILGSKAARDLRTGWRAVDASLASPGPHDYFAIHGATPTADRARIEILAERAAEV